MKQRFKFFSGEQNGYGMNSHPSSSAASSMAYSTLPHPHSSGLVVEAIHPYAGPYHTLHMHPRQQQHPQHHHHHQHLNGFPVELNLEMSNTPPPPPPPQTYAHMHPIQHNRHSLMLGPTSYGPLEDPASTSDHSGCNIIPPANENNDGPLCASSPKRSMSAFTTFGQRSPLSPTQMSMPSTGHLV